MTRPRWMRKRSSVTNLLDTKGRIALHRGEFSWETPRTKRGRMMSFKKDGTTDREKYTVFFSAVFAVINNAYTSVRKKELPKKDIDFLLFSTDTMVLIQALDIVYDRWADIEKNMAIAKEMRLTNEVPV